MADAHVETSELNQDSLDGNSASVSEVGSQESSPEIVASNEDEDSGQSKEAPEVAQLEESREAEGAEDTGAEVPKQAAENGTNGVTEHHVNGKNGNDTEADSTEVDGVAGEKRKSVASEEMTLSPKKAKVEENEADAPADQVPATNGQQNATAV